MRLALLPGLDGTGSLFEPLVSCLPRSLSPVIVQYPPRTPLSIAQLAELAANMLSGNERWLVLAESFSGPVALRLLADWPGPGIAGVIFGASFASPPRPRLLRVVSRAPLARLFAMTPPDWSIRIFCLGPHADGRTVTLLKQALSAVDPEVMAARFGALAALEPHTRPIALPCMYIRPNADRLVPSRNLDELRRLAPGMSVHHLDGPHFILQTAPRACADLIAAFARDVERTLGNDA